MELTSKITQPSIGKFICKRIGIIALAFIFCLSNSLNAQVKIGDNPATIDASSLLELESTDKGLLLPRMSTALRDAISSPATGLKIYNTTTGLFNYYDGAVWQVIESKARDNHVLVKSVADFPAVVAGVITLDANTAYELNGSIVISDKIDINNATIYGVDNLEDQLIYTGSSELFTGTKGGNLRDVLFVSTTAGSQLFNLTDAAKIETFLITSCIFSGNKKLGTIEGYQTFYMSENAFTANDDGFSFKNVGHLLLNNLNFLMTNKGTFIKLVDASAFNFIEITGGFYHPTSANSSTAIDFGTGVSITHGGELRTNIHGDGVRTTGSPSKEWSILSLGVDTQTDDVATGNFYISASATTAIAAVNTPVKIAGTTTGVNLFRMTSAVNNRLTYQGTKTRSFIINCSLSLTAVENGKRFNFYIAKNGTVLTETKQRRKIANGADVGVVSISGIVNLATGDYIEVWIENTNNASDVNVESMNLSIL